MAVILLVFFLFLHLIGWAQGMEGIQKVLVG